MQDRLVLFLLSDQFVLSICFQFWFRDNASMALSQPVFSSWLSTKVLGGQDWASAQTSQLLILTQHSDEVLAHITFHNWCAVAFRCQLVAVSGSSIIQSSFVPSPVQSWKLNLKALYFWNIYICKYICTYLWIFVIIKKNIDMRVCNFCKQCRFNFHNLSRMPRIVSPLRRGSRSGQWLPRDQAWLANTSTMASGWPD